MSVEAAVAGFNSLNLAWPQNVDLISEGDDSIRTFKTIVRLTYPAVNGAVTVSHTEMNYLAGVTSLIQGQIDAKAPLAAPTFTGAVVLPASTTIGPVSATELGYLDGVTSAIQAQIDAKAPLANPALTGVPTAPTAAPGTGTTQIATTAFAAALSFAAALPAQAGNAGKFVTTNSAAASWAFASIGETAVAGTAAACVANTRHDLNNAAATAMTLPLTPPDGTFCGFTPRNNRRDNTVLRNGATIHGVADDVMIDGLGTLYLYYNAAANDWRF